MMLEKSTKMNKLLHNSGLTFIFQYLKSFQIRFSHESTTNTAEESFFSFQSFK